MCPWKKTYLHLHLLKWVVKYTSKCVKKLLHNGTKKNIFFNKLLDHCFTFTLLLKTLSLKKEAVFACSWSNSKRVPVNWETEKNEKKRKEKKNEKKTRRKVTKRNAKKRNAKKRKQNSEKRNETKEKEKKRKNVVTLLLVFFSFFFFPFLFVFFFRFSVYRYPL